MSKTATQSWLTHFPWCREADQSEQGRPLGQGHFSPKRRYPSLLRNRYILVDHETFIEFMHSAWGLAVVESDLKTPRSS